MKLVSALCLTLLAVLSARALFDGVCSADRVPPDVFQLYSRWKQAHGKLYASPAEDRHRLAVFREELRFVEASNRNYAAKAAESGQRLSAPMFELNQFADLSAEEFKPRFAGLQSLAELREELLGPVGQAPGPGAVRASPQAAREQRASSVRSSGLSETFSPMIWHQGNCASCWSFSAVAAAEKQYFDMHRLRLYFSQQELVDCDGYSSGCSGGHPEYAFFYIANYGITLKNNYPYVAVQQYCRYSDTPRTQTPVVAPSKPFPYSQALVHRVTALGGHPVVAVYSLGAFRYLSRSQDVFDARLSGECEMQSDHAVNVYYSEGDQVSIFNSWGTQWGFGGSKRFKICAEDNLFGVGSRVAHPYGDI